MEAVTRIAIIGGGPAGYEAATVAADLGAEVLAVDEYFGQPLRNVRHPGERLIDALREHVNERVMTTRQGRR